VDDLRARLSGSSRRRVLPWWAFTALAASVLVLIVGGTVAGLFPWTRAPQQADAETVVARAITAVASLRLAGVPNGDLWFDRAGTFVAISSSQLTQSHLIRVAGSMSSTAYPAHYDTRR
jgi:hypothetical protein